MFERSSAHVDFRRTAIPASYRATAAVTTTEGIDQRICQKTPECRWSRALWAPILHPALFVLLQSSKYRTRMSNTMEPRNWRRLDMSMCSMSIIHPTISIVDDLFPLGDHSAPRYSRKTNPRATAIPSPNTLTSPNCLSTSAPLAFTMMPDPVAAAVAAVFAPVSEEQYAIFSP